jgi:GT2 family glycosyltransferase
LDADDYWGPKKLERQLEIAEASNADLVYTNSINVYEESSRSGIQSKNLPRRLSTWGLILCNHLVNSSVLVKRSALNSVGNFVESDIVLGVEDYATWLRVSLAGKLVGLDEPLVHYTISAASLSRRKNGRTRLDAIENFIDWIHSQVPHSPLSIVIEVFARIVALRESVPRRVRGLFHGVS